MGLAAVESKSRRKSWSKKAALLAEPQWSRYQNDIFDWVENGEGNLRIGAVAGSGKSTVLAAIVARLPSDAKIAILAFNKHIVDSMKGYRSDGTPKLPTRVTVTTAHSMGNALLSRVFEGMATIDNGKYRKITRPIIAALNVDPFVHNVGDVAKRWQKTAGVPQYVTYIVTEADRRVEIALVRRNWMKFALDLVRGCQSTLCIPHESGLKELIDYYGIEVPIGGELVISTIAEILNLGDSVAKDDHIIDFGDMLWLPHRWELQATSKDWLLIDEVQDANRAQLSLYEKCGRNGRVIVVGDADQAIQGFAFSSPKMWSEIGDRFNAKTLPLSVCYRCPTSHLDLARYFVPTIEAAPNAREGYISVIRINAVGGLVELGDLILCRFTAPLISACFDLIKRGIPAKVRGREIGANLSRLADIGEGNWLNFPAVIAQVMGDEIAKLKDEDKEDAAESVQDNLDCIVIMHSYFAKDCKSISDFIEKIESVFSDHESPVTLSTIHRSKGDEADRVFILMPNAMPYRRDGMLDWQEQQEDNLAYVALTRAKQSLVFVPIGRTEDETESLLRSPYGGMGVRPVRIKSDNSADVELIDPCELVKPYAIGDRVSILGCGPFVITGRFNPAKPEYTAEYVGDRNMRYWKCDRYGHSMITNINTLNN